METEGSAEQKNALRIPWLWTFALILADQSTKFLAVTRLKPAGRIPVIPGFFNLTYVENQGAAWGMLAGRQFLLITFSIVTLALLFWKRRQLFGALPCGGLILAVLTGGVIGNLIDRIRCGHVIDFLDFYWKQYPFPAFNVADSAICCSAFALVIAQWIYERKKVKGHLLNGNL